MFVVTLPFYDANGCLTPLVNDAREAGAISAHDPNDATMITLTFEDEADAVAFSTLARLAASDPNDVSDDIAMSADPIAVSFKLKR